MFNFIPVLNFRTLNISWLLTDFKDFDKDKNLQNLSLLLELHLLWQELFPQTKLAP